MRRMLTGRAGMALAFMLGIFIATGAAAAGAADLVSGKDIKDGTIGSKELSKTVQDKLNLTLVLQQKLKSVTTSLGKVNETLTNGLKPGPAGATGPAGPDGAQGPAGKDGSPDTADQVKDKLASVDGAGSGIDADTVDGMNASSLLPSCQAGTTRLYDFCVTPAQTATTWQNANLGCVNQNPSMRLPTVGELYEIYRATGLFPELWTVAPTDATHAISITGVGLTVTNHLMSDTVAYRCISNPRPASQLN